MAYQDKLKDPRWQKKRLEILTRDDWKCRLCEDTLSPLVVHHLCYFPTFEPWDYDDFYLMTLCESCHNEYRNTYRFFIKGVWKHLLLCKKSELEEYLDSPFNKETSLKLDCVLSLLGDIHE
jgi:5-methylcytosine-specific restriction endonuclease McrA